MIRIRNSSPDEAVSRPRFLSFSPLCSSPMSLRTLLVIIGPLYLENSGQRYWGADNFFSGGSTYSISSIPVANTVDDPIYQSERLGIFSYQIPVPIGAYEVSIYFAELCVMFVYVVPMLRVVLLTDSHNLFSSLILFPTFYVAEFLLRKVNGFLT
jgi:Malectin domain